jgi:hypothetical protein
MRKDEWSEGDIETLRTMAATGKSKTLIALRLKRTRGAVASFARERGIKFIQAEKRQAARAEGSAPSIERRALRTDRF